MDHSEHLAHGSWLPAWLRALWVIAFGVVALVHLRHARTMTGEYRLWHAGHVLMGAAMAYMYLSASLVPPAAAVALFATAAVAGLGVGAYFRLGTGRFNPLWLLAAAEMAVMVYMFLPMGLRSLPVSVVLAAYLAGIGLLWTVGWWDRHYRTGRPVPALRASLVTMTAGMAYMLLAM